MSFDTPSAIGMLDLHPMVLTLAIPAGAAILAALVFGLRTARHNGPPPRIGAAMLLAGVAAGLVTSFGLPWPLAQPWHWIGYGFAFVALPAAFVPTRSRIGELAMSAVLAVTVFGAGWQMLAPLVDTAVTADERLRMCLVAAGLAAAAAVASTEAGLRVHASRFAPAMLIWAVAAVFVLFQVGGSRSYQLIGMAAAVMTAGLALSWVRGEGVWLARIGTPFCVLLALAGLHATAYGSAPLDPVLLLCAPVLLPALWAAMRPQKVGAWIEAPLLVLLTAIPAAAAVWLLLEDPGPSIYVQG